MGPLVPDIITDELNLIVALVLGIGFGLVLEQAGFSSSRKLAGVFYGYDFTVLRVFFTAGVTAMLGVLLLGELGYLDTEAIFVNPMFIGPAIVGGLIMGVGFILGGYCPGTGICAAAIGKKDAIAFVVGGILGVFVFGELFPLYDVFYGSGAMGGIKVFSSLGISQGVFVLALVIVAVVAFAVTTKIQWMVSPAGRSADWPVKRHVLAAGILLLVALVVAVLPERKTALIQKAESAAYQQEHPLTVMTADELTFKILDHDPALMIVDVRPVGVPRAIALPGAVNISLDGLFARENATVLGMRHRQKVFVDDDGVGAAKAARVAALLGYEDVRVLENGLAGLQSTILAFKAPVQMMGDGEADVCRFRAHASVELTRMIDDARNESSKPKTAVKKIQGGC